MPILSLIVAALMLAGLVAVVLEILRKDPKALGEIARDSRAFAEPVRPSQPAVANENRPTVPRAA